MKAADMKNNIVKILFIALPVMSFVTPVQASPWWWPVNAPASAPVKTEQLALPANNGGMISVTVPSKKTAAKPAKGSPGSRQTKESSAAALHDQREDERIAADLERHF
jgi:hypothetical protein